MDKYILQLIYVIFHMLF